jgi:hypothetical protein
MVPLAGAMVSCGKFLGQQNSLRLAALPYATAGPTPLPLLPVATARNHASSALRETALKEVSLIIPR